MRVPQFRLWQLCIVVAAVACSSAWMRWAVYGGPMVGVMLEELKRVADVEERYRENITKVWLRDVDRLRNTPDANIYDDGLVISMMGNMKLLENLCEVNLEGCQITCKAVERICELEKLSSLNLGNTPLDDTVVPILCKVNKLRYLNVWGTNLTTEGLNELKDSLPDCEIRGT